jgi:hypothetical protein
MCECKCRHGVSASTPMRHRPSSGPAAVSHHSQPRHTTTHQRSYGHSLWHSLLSIVSAVVVDFLIIGLAISSTCWSVAAACFDSMPLTLLPSAGRLSAAAVKRQHCRMLPLTCLFSPVARPHTGSSRTASSESAICRTTRWSSTWSGEERAGPGKDAENCSSLPSRPTALPTVPARRASNPRWLSTHNPPRLAPRLYSFDVHCNSYFPLFLQLYGGWIPARMAAACVAC